MASGVEDVQSDDEKEVAHAERGEPRPPADGMARGRDRQVVWMDDGSGEERGAREGQERTGQGQDLLGGGGRRALEVQQKPDDQGQERGLVDPRGGAPLADRARRGA